MRSPMFCGLAVAVAVLAGGCGGSGTDTPGPEQAVGPYRLSPPSGLEAKLNPNAPPGMTSRTWTTSKDDRGITVGYTPHGLDLTVEEPDLEAVADGSLGGMKRLCRSLTVKSRSRVDIHELHGIRTEATGHDKGKPAMHSVTYVLADHENVIMLMAVATGSDAAARVANLDKCLLTFNRPGYVPAAKAATISERPNTDISLSEARRGFQSKLAPSTFESEPVEEPPSGVFHVAQYDTAVGKLPAYLTPDPGDGQRHPAIVWITGGDCNTIGDVWSKEPADNDQSARAYREAGIVMMFPSLRGGNENPGQREGLLGEVDDVLAAADYLARQPYVDPQRIYLGGHSTGGTLALLVAACSDRFRAIVAFGPVENVATYGKDFLPFDHTSQRELEVRAPILWLHGVRSPTFVIEGTDGNADSLRAMQQATNNERIHFFVITGESHFSVLAPINRLIADRILQDTGPNCNLNFTGNELAQQCRSPSAGLHARRGPVPPEPWEAMPEAGQSPAAPKGAPGAEAIRNQPSHPDYFKENLAALRSNSSLDRDGALDRLVNAKPEDVGDVQLQGEIARAMRDVAFATDAGVHLRQKAIRGLVVWGSTYSVPLLLELLNDDSPFVVKAAVAALGELKDERAIEPLAEKFMSDVFSDREIAACLRQFGPRAEDAVLKRADMADNPIKARRTVELLGQIGTAKSLRFFRKISSNRQTAFFLGSEIQAATRAIQQRTAKAKD